jgi:hypothetical protein
MGLAKRRDGLISRSRLRCMPRGSVKAIDMHVTERDGELYGQRKQRQTRKTPYIRPNPVHDAFVKLPDCLGPRGQPLQFYSVKGHSPSWLGHYD